MVLKYPQLVLSINTHIYNSRFITLNNVDNRYLHRNLGNSQIQVIINYICVQLLFENFKYYQLLIYVK